MAAPAPGAPAAAPPAVDQAQQEHMNLLRGIDQRLARMEQRLPQINPSKRKAPEYSPHVKHDAVYKDLKRQIRAKFQRLHKVPSRENGAELCNRYFEQHPEMNEDDKHAISQWIADYISKDAYDREREWQTELELLYLALPVERRHGHGFIAAVVRQVREKKDIPEGSLFHSTLATVADRWFHGKREHLAENRLAHNQARLDRRNRDPGPLAAARRIEEQLRERGAPAAPPCSCGCAASDAPGS